MTGSGRRVQVSIAAALALTSILAFAPGARGATFTVTNTNDAAVPPAGSLREAIAGALTSGDASSTIGFAPGVTGTIQLVSALPTIASKTLVIAGPGANQLEVRGEGAADRYPVFPMCGDDASDGADVTIAGLTIANGGGTNVLGVGTSSGGGVFARGFATCSLTLSGTTVSGNSTNAASAGTTAASALGGGVYIGNGANLAVSNSTFSGNTATASVTAGANPAGAHGGGIWTAPFSGTVTIANSTISGNSTSAAATAGAGSASGGGLTAGPASIHSATFTANSVSATGGASTQARGSNIAGQVISTTPLGTPDLQNTIVSAGSGASNCAGGIDDIGPVPLTSSGNNLSSDGSCFLGHPADFPGVDPLLGPLAANGGPTLTHLPLTGSPAIDQGFSDGLTTDQRGAVRPSQSLDPVQTPVPPLMPARVNTNGGDGADIGAVEITRPADPPPDSDPDVPILRKIHFSLRFKFVDKHGRRFVTARVFCHSVACVLEGSGRIRILPFNEEDGKRRTGVQTFELGDASGSYVFTKGRKVAGTLRFKVDGKTARAVKRAILAGARGRVRGDIQVNGVNTFQPDLNKHRFRDIKLFARSRGGAG